MLDTILTFRRADTRVPREHGHPHACASKHGCQSLALLERLPMARKLHKFLHGSLCLMLGQSMRENSILMSQLPGKPGFLSFTGMQHFANRVAFSAVTARSAFPARAPSCQLCWRSVPATERRLRPTTPLSTSDSTSASRRCASRRPQPAAHQRPQLKGDSNNGLHFE